MPKKLPIFYSALLLTLVNLLLRFVGTSFQVYLSGRIGPAGIGLLQLVMSIGGMGMVAGTAGIRTAAMYLTAGELGRNRQQNVTWVLSGCFLYSILLSACTALILYCFAPWIAENWLGNAGTIPALRLLAGFLPAGCLCGVMTGYFTAANRIGTLAAVEVAEQLCSMAATLVLLGLFSNSDPGIACQAVVFGSSLGSIFTLTVLVILRLKERPVTGPRIPVARDIVAAAVPLAAADDLRTGISTLENLIVPRRLAQNSAVSDPLAAFGIVSGMVFPVLMFPACILYGLCELLIPELARCNSSGSRVRIRYLTRRSLKTAFLYGIAFSGLMYLISGQLCQALYASTEAGNSLKLYAFLIPMLYCDAIADAMTKGLGQQRICVRYNILTNLLDVAFLYFLLPRYGMAGYFFSFALTHMLNFILSLRRLLKITGQRIRLSLPLRGIGVLVGVVFVLSHLQSPLSRGLLYPITLASGLYLAGVVRLSDLRWVKNLLHPAKQ